MMSRVFILIGLMIFAAPAMAQAPTSPPTPPTQSSEQQALEQAQSRYLAAGQEYFQAAARKLQVDLMASRKAAADTAAWWDAWWKGMYPAQAPKK